MCEDYSHLIEFSFPRIASGSCLASDFRLAIINSYLLREFPVRNVIIYIIH